MKKIVTLLLITICFASLILTISPKVYSQAYDTKMKVLSYSWYTSPFSGYFVVVGEVQNIGPDTLSNAILRGIVYTSDQQQQAVSMYTVIYSSLLLPNETAPFYMMFTPETSNNGTLEWVSLGIDHVDFTFFTTATQDAPYSGLYLGASDPYVDSSGNYTVEGVVVNRGNLYPQYIWVAAAFYDASGKVVAVGVCDYLSPRYLAPTNSTLFSVTPTDPTAQMATEIASYKLQILSKGVVETPPSSSPSPSGTSSPSSSATPTAGPSDSTLPGVTPSPETGLYISMNTVYAIVVAIVVVVVIIVLAFVLRKKSKTKGT